MFYFATTSLVVNFSVWRNNAHAAGYLHIKNTNIFWSVLKINEFIFRRMSLSCWQIIIIEILFTFFEWFIVDSAITPNLSIRERLLFMLIHRVDENKCDHWSYSLSDLLQAVAMFAQVLDIFDLITRLIQHHSSRTTSDSKFHLELKVQKNSHVHARLYFQPTKVVSIVLHYWNYRSA